MIASLSVILICQLIGEVIVRALRAPLPGPVVGLALLFIVLITRDRFAVLAQGPLRDNAVEQQLDLIAQRGLAIFAILAASVLVTLLVTVGTFLITSRMMRRGRSAP